MENKIAMLFQEENIKVRPFARRNGIAYGTLYDIASGRTPLERVSVGTANQIANGFGMSLTELLGEPVLDETKFELLNIYADLPPIGRRFLVACAQAIFDVCQDEALEAEYEQRYQDEMGM